MRLGLCLAADFGSILKRMAQVIFNRRRFVGIAAGAALSAASPLVASAQLVNKYAEQLKNGEFNWFRERSADGPLLIIVSIPDQLLHVYRNGIRVAASTCSTGKPGHSTPTGVFKILQKGNARMAHMPSTVLSTLTVALKTFNALSTGGKKDRELRGGQS